MSYGIQLRDSNGYLYYDSSDSNNGEFMLVIDSFTVAGNESGSRDYYHIQGISGDILEFQISALGYASDPPLVGFTGTTLTWTANPDADSSDTFHILVITV
jgi:hypothetical protein